MGDDGNGPGLCPMEEFCISGAEPLSSTTRQLGSYLISKLIQVFIVIHVVKQFPDFVNLEV
jgi:hypothetical protein